MHANPMPTTSGQAALWYADQKRAANGGYNVSIVWTINQDVPAPEIAVSWSRLRQEVPALSVRMGLDRDGAVVQWTCAEELAQEYADFADSPDAEMEAAAFLSARTARAFDTDGGPLARLVVARVSREVMVVTLVAHHLIVDGVSQVHLARRFAAALQPFGEEPSSQHYADLIDLVRQDESRTHPADRAYWSERVAGFLNGADWFAADPMGDLGVRAGRRRGEVVGADLASLTAAARDLGVGLYLLVAAAVHRAMAMAGVERTVVCSAVSVRPIGGALDDVVGCFINLVPLTARHLPGETLGELVRREAAGWRRDHCHRNLSLLEIGGTGSPPNRLDRVFFSYRETDPTLTWTGPGPDVSADLFTEYPATRSDLTVRVLRGVDRLHYEVEWSTATPWGAVFADALEVCLQSPSR
ncbi:hypothetical protein GCM10010517_75950 [Streptosporangium fragile]|uniref:Condensation domain-containing protein n=2 Tax=Streptosporangium fragile TaxID=46186 RepID=A0ABN3WCJ2_9ACTN